MSATPDIHSPSLLPRAASSASAEDEPVLSAIGLSKTFKLYARPADRLLEWLSWGVVRRHRTFAALENASFSVRRGECLGIIGPNGSGKSTLLKLLTGVLQPSAGHVQMRGRLLSLLELGAGVSGELTGRQNVLSSGQLLAFPPGYAETMMGEIEAFAELGRFFDQPVRTYSSGMAVRLAFSMFACFQPDLFLVDEALSVGDVYFQQKCVRRIEEMRSAGTTFLFVSHDMAAVRRLCTQVVVLQGGRTVFAGNPEEAVSRYYALCGGSPAAVARREAVNEDATPQVDHAELLQHSVLLTAKGRHGGRALELVAATIQTADSRHQLCGLSGERVVLTLLLQAFAPIASPAAGLHLYDRLGNLVFAGGTRQLDAAIPPMRAGEQRAVRLGLTLNVAPGEYTLSLGASEPSPHGSDLGIVHDRWEGIGPLTVVAPEGPATFFGIARLPLEVLP